MPRTRLRGPLLMHHRVCAAAQIYIIAGSRLWTPVRKVSDREPICLLTSKYDPRGCTWTSVGKSAPLWAPFGVALDVALDAYGLKSDCLSSAAATPCGIGMGLGSDGPMVDRSRMTLCGIGMGLGPESDKAKKEH